MRTSDPTRRDRPTEAPTQRLPPERVVLDRYRLEERIGAGGFGVVWRAFDERLHRHVAVKSVPRARDGAEDARTEREALAAARLNHPGIVALYELGSDQEDVHLVSELVNGATLEELMRERALSDRDLARVGSALCDALAHAHARGVIHRDVKPSNVMVLAEPAAGAGFAKLTDFGIARIASGEDLTATGDVVGTLAYMAPEQAEGRRVDAACDVYSLALTLYEGWTGSNPVRAEGPAATARRLGRPLPPLRSRRPDLPPELAEAIDAALDPEPALRPGPAELAAVLRECEGALLDDGGLVEPETIERFGLTAVRARTRLRTLLPGRRPHPIEEERGFPVALWRRGGAASAAGLLVLVALETLGPDPSFSPAAAALATAALVAALPRMGWIAAALFVCGWLATPAADRPGTALVLFAALAAAPLLMPRDGHLWSLPALAPLLGAIALAPLFVGVAALAGTAWRRAGLAACGFLWLAAAEILTGDELLFGAADGTLARQRWQGSALDAVGDALLPVVTSPALAPAVVWAVFAFLFPVLARGRWAAIDILLACAWVGGLAGAHAALGDLLAATTELDRARGAVAGAALGGLVAVTVTLMAPPVEDGPRDPALL